MSEGPTVKNCEHRHMTWNSPVHRQTDMTGNITFQQECISVGAYSPLQWPSGGGGALPTGVCLGVSAQMEGVFVLVHAGIPSPRGQNS